MRYSKLSTTRWRTWRRRWRHKAFGMWDDGWCRDNDDIWLWTQVSVKRERGRSWLGRWVSRHRGDGHHYCLCSRFLLYAELLCKNTIIWLLCIMFDTYILHLCCSSFPFVMHAPEHRNLEHLTELARDKAFWNDQKIHRESAMGVWYPQPPWRSVFVWLFHNNASCDYDGGDCCVKRLDGPVLKDYCSQCTCLDPKSHWQRGIQSIWYKCFDRQCLILMQLYIYM